MRKLLLTGSLVLTMALAGCGVNSEEKDMNIDDSLTVSIDNDDTSSNTDTDDLNEPGSLENPNEGRPGMNTDQFKVGEVITAGEIMAFDGDNVHIIMGDIVQIFEVDQANINNFYLNQSVSIVKGEDNNLLKPNLQDDFSITHTNMGMLLEQVKGSVTKVTEGVITIETLDGPMDFTTYAESYVELGSEVTLVFADYGSEKGVIYLLNETTKLSLTVSEINRSNEGEMLLSLVDSNEGEYVVGTSGVLLKLNLSEIRVGEQLTFYHDGIMESWPMQLNLIMIEK